MPLRSKTSQEDSEESKQIFQEYQDKFKKVCPTASVVHVEGDSSTTVTPLSRSD